MKTVNKIVISSIALLSLGLTAASTHAQQGPMGNMGPGMMRGAMMQNQMADQSSNMKLMRELMTPAERLNMMDKMIDAKTPEERQSIMISTHAEMEKRAKAKGISLPSNHNTQMMSGRSCG